MSRRWITAFLRGVWELTLLTGAIVMLGLGMAAWK